MTRPLTGKVYRPVSGATDRAFTSGLGAVPTDLYIYPPLPSPRSIRLLAWPNDLVPSTELGCRLCIVDLDDPTGLYYTALSYTWGEPSGEGIEDVDSIESLLTNTIVCEGRRLRVTE